MESTHIAQLFTALRGGALRDLREDQEDGTTTLRFRVYLPELAKRQHPDFSSFFGVLGNCEVFSLQPFRNENAVVEQLSQIERLELQVEEGEAKGNRVHVFCSHKGASSGARLTIKAGSFEVLSEDFDRMTPESLGDLRQLSAD